MTVLLTTLLALLLLFLILQDAFEVMLLPRRVARRLRLVRVFFRLGWSVWSGLAARIPPGPGRERLLSVFGPLSMMALFSLWAVGFILSFGLLLWAAQDAGGPHPPNPLIDQLYLSGVTFFTLGYGDIVPVNHSGRFLAIVEAGTGFSLIAMVISYLPVLYQLFARRETHVILLDSRAGSPPTAGTLLRRHAGPGGPHQLDRLMQAWEIWAAELLESHMSYPMLAYYRSQHDNQSWLAAVAAVIDSCALILVASPPDSPTAPSLLQARMTFAMLRQLLLEMTRSFDILPDRDAGTGRLDAAAYAHLAARIESPGWTAAPDTEPLLAALRTTYEPLLSSLSSYLLVPLPGLFPDADADDHWDQGARGTLARRLIEELAARTDPDPTPGSVWRSVRSRLKLPPG